MSRARRRVVDTPPLLITSMLDMFTIILVFLITFLDPNALPDTEGVQLAPARGAATGAREGEVRFVVDDDRFLVGDAEVARWSGASPANDVLATVEDSLRGALPTVVADDAPARLLVVVDRQVPWSALSPALAAAERAGFTDFRFVVVQEEE